jgi:hypothetical protein
VSWDDENASFGQAHRCFKCEVLPPPEQPPPELQEEIIAEVSYFDSVQPVLQAEASSFSFIDQCGFFLFRGEKKPSKMH